MTTGRIDGRKERHTGVVSVEATDVAALSASGKSLSPKRKWGVWGGAAAGGVVGGGGGGVGGSEPRHSGRARADAPNDPAAGLMMVLCYGLQQGLERTRYRPLRSSSPSPGQRRGHRRTRPECRSEPARRTVRFQPTGTHMSWHRFNRSYRRYSGAVEGGKEIHRGE